MPPRTTSRFLLLLPLLLVLQPVALHLAPASLVHARRLESGSRSAKRKLAQQREQPPPHFPLDPLVAEVQRRREDEAWEQQYEERYHQHQHVEAGHHREHRGRQDDLTVDEFTEEEAEHEEFLHDAGVDDPGSLDQSALEHLDMGERLEKLFPLIDVEPADGKIDVRELTAWELRQYSDLQDHRMQREFEAMDSDSDGKISLKEYLRDRSEGDDVKHWSEYPEKEQEFHRQEQERFEAIDEDKDEYLDRHQLYTILHPEESDDPRIKALLRQEEIRLYDEDKNGKIELSEFLEGFWTAVRHWEDDERQWADKSAGRPVQEQNTSDEDERHEDGKAHFNSLDVDQDGSLSEKELEPIMHIIVPGEAHYAEQTARYYIEQADGDNDARLTLKEMKQHKDIFYDIDQKQWEDVMDD